MKFTILVNPILLIIVIYSVSWSALEKKIFKEIMHFHYKSNTAMSWHKNACHVGHEIYNFGRLFLGHQYVGYTFSLSEPGVEEKDF